MEIESNGFTIRNIEGAEGCRVESSSAGVTLVNANGAPLGFTDAEFLALMPAFEQAARRLLVEVPPTPPADGPDRGLQYRDCDGDIWAWRLRYASDSRSGHWCWSRPGNHTPHCGFDSDAEMMNAIKGLNMVVLPR